MSNYLNRASRGALSMGCPLLIKVGDICAYGFAQPFMAAREILKACVVVYSDKLRGMPNPDRYPGRGRGLAI